MTKEEFLQTVAARAAIIWGEKRLEDLSDEELKELAKYNTDELTNVLSKLLPEVPGLARIEQLSRFGKISDRRVEAKRK